MLAAADVKFVRNLQLKKFRDAQNVFVAEGTKLVLDLLASRTFICIKIFALDTWLLQHNSILQKYEGPAIISVKAFELQKISAFTTPNNIVAIFQQKVVSPNIVCENKINLVLDGIQDPGNFGTIIRTADWFGIINIICSPLCADLYNPKVVQSTMGSLGNADVLYTELQPFLASQKVPIYAASLQGIELQKIQAPTQAIVIIGNEGQGISPQIMDLVNKKVTIEKIGKAESLNAAVAAGIILAKFTGNI
jgi:RNA methyltransferase, TrmH family